MVEWTDGDAFRIGATEFVCCPILRGGFASEPGRFCLVKPRSAVEAYERLLREQAPAVIVEIGIYEGASTAFIAETARPDKLVAIELSERPLPALADFIETRGWRDTLSVHCGVDQADGATLRSIVAAEVGDRPVDLVIDDASHSLDATRRTFNCLFPLLRAGGSYVIEDWWWAHTRASEAIRPDDVPLSVMVFELVLACAYEPATIASVTTNRDWTLVTRGPAGLGPGFDLSQCYGPRGRALVAGL